MAVEAVENRSLTMTDLTQAAAHSFARSRTQLERRDRVRDVEGVTFGEAVADLVFETESSPFPWWSPEGVSWLDYLFGTYIRMQIALFPTWSSRRGLDDRAVLLAVGESEVEAHLAEARATFSGERLDRMVEEGRVILALVREVEKRRSEALYARNCQSSLLSPSYH